MLWSRSRYLLLVLTLAALPLGWMAGGAGRLGGPGGPGIVDFELAGTAGVGSILRAWQTSGAMSAARSALLWDFGFIVFYVLFGALLAAAIARRTHWPWDALGPVAALAVTLAGALDVLENLALLSVLQGSVHNAGPARVLALAKFALVGVGALAAVVLLLERALSPKVSPPRLNWEIGAGSADDRNLLNCDLVMKGGITSGVVYPGAVFALARRYRFVNIGGSSAGAIAAAVTAAAEYRRRANKTVAGFEALREVTASLAADERLFKLFQPAPACAALFDVVAAALRPGWAVLRLAWVVLTALASFPLATLFSLAPGALVFALGAHPELPARSTGFLLVACAGLTLLLIPLGWLAAGAWRVMRAFPSNGYGLCPGTTQGDRAGDGLSS
jgi:Patatin-like phospholipase